MRKSTHSTRFARSGQVHSIGSGLRVISISSLQTKNIAKALARALFKAQPKKKAYVFALKGELGSGKTTFAQGFAKGLGIKERILSPTFLIIKKFQISNFKFKNFYHIDCYRLDAPEKELLYLGWEKIIQDPRNIVMVEWADRIKKILPLGTVWVTFQNQRQNKRTVTITELR